MLFLFLHPMHFYSVPGFHSNLFYWPKFFPLFRACIHDPEIHFLVILKENFSKNPNFPVMNTGFYFFFNPKLRYLYGRLLMSPEGGTTKVPPNSFLKKLLILCVFKIGVINISICRRNFVLRGALLALTGSDVLIKFS